MQRKPGFPLANCNIKIPDAAPPPPDSAAPDEDWEQRRRQQLINFGHSQWGFNNWSWSVTKQDLDFVDFVYGKHTAGVASFVLVTVKSLDIHRENVGYATTTAPMKGSAIYQARKGAVTNALRETLLSFGGSVTSELLELLEASRAELPAPPAPPPADTQPENNQNIINKLPEPKNINIHMRKDDAAPHNVPVAPVVPHNVRSPHPGVLNPAVKNLPPAANKPLPANAPRAPPPLAPPPLAPPQLAPPRHNNEAQKPVTAPSLDNMTDEEARAERKRRQRQAQEEFRLKQMMKSHGQDGDKVDKQELHKKSFDNLLLDIPTQDIIIEETGNTVADGKRKSPEPGSGSAAKRRAAAGAVAGKLDIVTD